MTDFQRALVARAITRLDELCDQCDNDHEANAESHPYYKEPRDIQAALREMIDGPRLLDDRPGCLDGDLR